MDPEEGIRLCPRYQRMYLCVYCYDLGNPIEKDGWNRGTNEEVSATSKRRCQRPFLGQQQATWSSCRFHDTRGLAGSGRTEGGEGWKEAQNSSLSIWKPVTDGNGDDKFGLNILHELETPGRQPGGDVTKR